jgi:hypothetical protein
VSNIGDITNFQWKFIAFDDLDCVLASLLEIHPILQIAETKISMKLLFCKASYTAGDVLGALSQGNV